MPATTTATTVVPQLPAVGSVITARTWKAGQQAAKATRGLVLLHNNPGTANAFAVAWFPALGAPKLGGSASSVHGVMPREVESVTKLDEVPATWVVTAERVARQARAARGYNIGFAAGAELERTAKAHRAARRARRAAAAPTVTPADQEQEQDQAARPMITVYVATDRASGGNAHVPGAPCVQCDTTYDPHNRRAVPCVDPYGHAAVTVSNWRRNGITAAVVAAVDVPAGDLDEARRAALAQVEATCQTA